MHKQNFYKPRAHFKTRLLKGKDIEILYSDHILFYFIPDISIAPIQVHYYSEALPTTLLSDLSHRSATNNCESLAQGPYVAARVGSEPATLRMQGTEPTTKPPCST